MQISSTTNMAVSSSSVEDVDKTPSCTLYICTSCRERGMPREPKENRSGFILYERVKNAVFDSPLKNQIEVKAAECLSICPRPCGIAIATSQANHWQYLFGDQDPDRGVDEIVECVSVYLQSEAGFMARSARPKSLRSSILGRIPPLGER